MLQVLGGLRAAGPPGILVQPRTSPLPPFLWVQGSSRPRSGVHGALWVWGVPLSEVGAALMEGEERPRCWDVPRHRGAPQGPADPALGAAKKAVGGPSASGAGAWKHQLHFPLPHWGNHSNLAKITTFWICFSHCFQGSSSLARTWGWCPSMPLNAHGHPRGWAGRVPPASSARPQPKPHLPPGSLHGLRGSCSTPAASTPNSPSTSAVAPSWAPPHEGAAPGG